MHTYTYTYTYTFVFACLLAQERAQRTACYFWFCVRVMLYTMVSQGKDVASY